MELIILGHLVARRQRAALRGDTLGVTAQLDLLGEKRGARGAVLRAFARILETVIG